MRQADFEKITTASALEDDKPYQILFSRKDYRRPLNVGAVLSVIVGLVLSAAFVAVSILIKG